MSFEERRKLWAAQLGQRLSDLRKRAKKTQEGLGAELGVSGALVSCREQGKSRIDDSDLAATLAAVKAAPSEALDCWRFLLMSQGHPDLDADRMAKAKVNSGEVAA